MRYRSRLPQLDATRCSSPTAGIETTLIFHQGLELPAFAAFDLLKDDAGTRGAAALLRAVLELAREHGLGFVLESPTWRASPRWGAQLGYDAERARGGSTAGRWR